MLRRRQPLSMFERQRATLRTAAEFYPTPLAVAREMLDLAEAGPSDVVYDLGSGDARIPILAAQEFGCRAVGIELDPRLCRHARSQIQEYGLNDRVVIQQQDFFEADLRPATVVTLYLLPAVNAQLCARLASHLRPGARVVTLEFPVPGWRPEHRLPVRSENGVEYTLYLYRR